MWASLSRGRALQGPVITAPGGKMVECGILNNGCRVRCFFREG
jgi:hypothetical protein